MEVYVTYILLTTSRNTSNSIVGYPRTSQGAKDAVPND